MNLGELDPQRRALLVRDARDLRLARGAAVYLPGDRADRVFAVADGRVKLVRTTPSGAESIVGIRGNGDIFGELLALEPRAVRGTSAIAIEPTTVHAIPGDGFQAALAGDAELARAFARGVARRLTLAETELVELLGKSVPGRLVDLLGRLAAEHGVPGDDGTVRIGISLTHQDLADVIGTSRETLTKELGVLADVGLLRIAHRTIVLVQPRAFPFRRREPS